MQEMWSIDYTDIKVYPVQAEPLDDPPYWYVDDGWCGKMGDTLFHTKKAALDHLLRGIAAARAELYMKFVALTEEWCHAE